MLVLGLQAIHWTPGLIDSLYNMMSSSEQELRVLSLDASDNKYVVEITDNGSNINVKFGSTSGWYVVNIVAFYCCGIFYDILRIIHFYFLVVQSGPKLQAWRSG